ncbi:ENV1 protein, partial [Origma solitaria]|nr:ENV1 protein [Origma solitaria]
KMLQASYGVLNLTHPELTKECYSIKPPYYEAIGHSGKIRKKNGTNPLECKWGDQENSTPGITLTSVTGKGVCIG